eukprot:scaffold112272_cov32-Tisochrysis_lutea.AAC.2
MRASWTGSAVLARRSAKVPAVSPFMIRGSAAGGCCAPVGGSSRAQPIANHVENIFKQSGFLVTCCRQSCASCFQTNLHQQPHWYWIVESRLERRKECAESRHRLQCRANAGNTKLGRE